MNPHKKFLGYNKFYLPNRNHTIMVLLAPDLHDTRDGQTVRASSILEPKMASFHSSAPALKKSLASAPK